MCCSCGTCAFLVLFFSSIVLTTVVICYYEGANLQNFLREIIDQINEELPEWDPLAQTLRHDCEIHLTSLTLKILFNRLSPLGLSSFEPIRTSCLLKNSTSKHSPYSTWLHKVCAGPCWAQCRFHSSPRAWPTATKRVSKWRTKPPLPRTLSIRTNCINRLLPHC